MPKNIVIKGARVNNLKNIDVEIPRDSLVASNRTFRLGQELACV